jgi:hypothetical protein
MDAMAVVDHGQHPRDGLPVALPGRPRMAGGHAQAVGLDPHRRRQLVAGRGGGLARDRGHPQHALGAQRQEGAGVRVRPAQGIENDLAAEGLHRFRQAEHGRRGQRTVVQALDHGEAARIAVRRASIIALHPLLDRQLHGRDLVDAVLRRAEDPRLDRRPALAWEGGIAVQDQGHREHAHQGDQDQGHHAVAHRGRTPPAGAPSGRDGIGRQGPGRPAGLRTPVLVPLATSPAREGSR